MSTPEIGGSEAEEDVSSGLEVSTDLVSTSLTREDGLTVGGTSSAAQEGGDELSSTPVVSDSLGVSLQDEVVVALPPTESEGAGEYHEIALTGSAALDLLDQVSTAISTIIMCHLTNPLAGSKQCYWEGKGCKAEKKVQYPKRYPGEVELK